MSAGQILWLDWRRDAVPKEANKLRPGIVVESSELFAPSFQNFLVVPCTTALSTEVASLCVRIDADESNGFDRTNWAVAHGVTSAAKRRVVRETSYFVSPQQLVEIRSRIAEVLGF